MFLTRPRQAGTYGPTVGWTKKGRVVFGRPSRLPAGYYGAGRWPRRAMASTGRPEHDHRPRPAVRTRAISLRALAVNRFRIRIDCSLNEELEKYAKTEPIPDIGAPGTALQGASRRGGHLLRPDGFSKIKPMFTLGGGATNAPGDGRSIRS
jgi:hypothetical protein